MRVGIYRFTSKHSGAIYRSKIAPLRIAAKREAFPFENRSLRFKVKRGTLRSKIATLRFAAKREALPFENRSLRSAAKRWFV